MNSIFISGFIVGGLTTAVGRYCWQKLIDNRRADEDAVNNKKRDMEMLFNDHPEFMNLFKNKINDPESRNIREFFVVERNAILNSSIPRFRFELTPDILLVLNKLESMGYIQKLENNCLHYKISDECIVEIKSLTEHLGSR
ncbi:hypothetical protein [Legionella shakespearei]|uniref:Uncharacterized protein n=1 Tax=Legionella shakespearei DSM 23087 TaxID=1122169 RepID=A0A0W0YWS8_9GAMM|nr:hypothetical protein [Legionella shakespearei]KTD61338.1 hypothetical protein Lsha_1245 [Legionella shakespearei DSM 23087]